MDTGNFINSFLNEWEETKKNLTDSDVKFIANKLNKQGKRIGRFTKKYRSRENLIKNSFITTGYTFKTWQNTSMANNGVTETWVLFSPAKTAIMDEEFFGFVLEKINELQDKKHKTVVEKKFLNIISNELSDCDYFEINKIIKGLKYPVFMSTCSMFKDLNIKINHGFNVILYNRKLSKEILYLADSYIPKSFSERYIKPEKEKDND